MGYFFLHLAEVVPNQLESMMKCKHGCNNALRTGEQKEMGGSKKNKKKNKEKAHRAQVPSTPLQRTSQQKNRATLKAEFTLTNSHKSVFSLRL